MLVPVAVTTVGHGSSVNLRLSLLNVSVFIQLLDAPVSYSALIFTFEHIMGKTVPVVGPTATVQISTKCLSVLCTSW